MRGDFSGGSLSADLGPLLLRGIDRQIGLTGRLAAAFDDGRHPSYIQHGLRDLLAQRIFQVGCAYEDAYDADALHTDPMFKLGLDQRPLNEDNDLACAATFSRLENAASSKDSYRMGQAFADQFIAG